MGDALWKTTSFTKGEWFVVLRKLQICPEEEHLLAACLHVACLGTWKALPANVTKYKCLKFMRGLLGAQSMNPAIRFRACEREQFVTALLDITTTRMRFKPTAVAGEPGHEYTSGHKGVCIKYQFTTTAQGTIIDVRGPWPGRRHDMFRFEEPFDAATNDIVLCDGGYNGLLEPAVVPCRKPPRRELPEEQQQFNRGLGRYRSRIERLFGSMKARFAVLKSTTMQEHIHALFIRLISLCLLRRPRDNDAELIELAAPSTRRHRVPHALRREQQDDDSDDATYAQLHAEMREDAARRRLADDMSESDESSLADFSGDGADEEAAEESDEASVEESADESDSSDDSSSEEAPPSRAARGRGAAQGPSVGLRGRSNAARAAAAPKAPAPKASAPKSQPVKKFPLAPEQAAAAKKPPGGRARR